MIVLKENQANTDTKWGNDKDTKPLEAWLARKVWMCLRDNSGYFEVDRSGEGSWEEHNGQRREKFTILSMSNTA